MVIVLQLVEMQAKKADARGVGPSTDTGNIAIGTDSAAQGGNSVAIGYESKTRGNGGTAVGQGAKAGVSKMMAQHLQLLVIMQMLLQVGSTALGFQTVASTKQATAAGYKASASGEKVQPL